MNILITGLSGLLGGLLGKELSARHRVTGLCRSHVIGHNQVNASITDYEDILPAFENADVVVHLAAFRSDDPIGELLRTNVDGTYNVFKAATNSGVRRVIFASSCGLVRGYLKGWQDATTLAPEPPPQIDADSAPWPVRPYDATKVAGESIARVFHENSGIETVCVRVGKCSADDIPVEGRTRPFWVSQRDITHLLALSVEYPEPLGFEIVYGVSENCPRAVDLGSTRNLFGYEPQDGCEWTPITGAKQVGQ